MAPMEFDATVSTVFGKNINKCICKSCTSLKATRSSIASDSGWLLSLHLSKSNIIFMFGSIPLSAKWLPEFTELNKFKASNDFSY